MTVAPPKPSVLFLDKINLAKEVYNELQQHAEVVDLTASDRKDFLADLKQGAYGDFAGIYRHFKAGRSITITGRIDDEVVSALPESVKFIAHNGAGYDQIDVNACSSRSIQVANVPSVVDAPTADTAMFLILSCLRQFPSALAAAHTGEFNSRLPLSNDPQDKMLGILGLGGIGKALAARAKAFGMKVTYHNRTRLSAEAESALGVQYVGSMDELLTSSDVVSLNLPLTAATKHLISTRQFELMKPSAVLINTARGPIVDEMALVNALDNGQIAGAGLDVYEDEPHIPAALLKHPGAVCLPHVGTVTLETQKEMEAVCLRNIMSALKTGSLPYVVAEQRT